MIMKTVTLVYGFYSLFYLFIYLSFSQVVVILILVVSEAYFLPHRASINNSQKNK